MRGLILAICGSLLGLFVLLFTLRHHVVLSEEGVLLLCKRQCTLSDTFIDLRDGNTFNWARHPHLARTIYRTGRDTGQHALFHLACLGGRWNSPETGERG